MSLPHSRPQICACTPCRNATDHSCCCCCCCLQAIGQFGQGLVNQVQSLGNQVSGSLADSMGQATGTIAQGMFRGLGSGFGQLGQGLLNPNMRVAGPSQRRLAAAAVDSSSGGGGGVSDGDSSSGGVSVSQGSGRALLAEEAIAGGVSMFPEAAMAGSMVGSIGGSSSSSSGGKRTRELLHFDPVAAAGSAGAMVVASSSMGSKDGSGSSGGSDGGSSGGSTRSLQQVDFFAAPLAMNDFVSQGVTSGAFGTQLGGDLNGQIQAGLQALVGTGNGIGGNALNPAATTPNTLGVLARMAGFGGNADPFNAPGGNGGLGGLGNLISNVVGGGGGGAGGGGSSGKKKGGLGGLLSGLTHSLGGRGSSSGSSGSNAGSSDSPVAAASVAGTQYNNPGSSTMYSSFTPQQQQQGGLEQGGFGGMQGLAGQQQQGLPGQQQQQGPYMTPDQYSQAFQQMTKIPGQAVGALAGYGTGMLNQGIQTAQNLGGQVFGQVGQNLATGQPVLGGNNQPVVVQGLGQDPNTYVIGGSDYYPGGSGPGQVQQLEQGSAGLVTGQMVPQTTLRNQYAGGALGTGGQFVSQPTQPAGVIDTTTGKTAWLDQGSQACHRLLEL
jgi:hypothetical protein